MYDCIKKWNAKADLLMVEIRDLLNRATQHLQDFPGGELNGNEHTYFILQKTKEDILKCSNDN